MLWVTRQTGRQQIDWTVLCSCIPYWVMYWWCRQQNSMGRAVPDWVIVRLHNLHGILHRSPSTARRLKRWQSTGSARHQVSAIFCLCIVLALSWIILDPAVGYHAPIVFTHYGQLPLKVPTPEVVWSKLSCYQAMTFMFWSCRCHLIVIIADFLPSIKNSSFSTFISSHDFLTMWLTPLQWS